MYNTSCPLLGITKNVDDDDEIAQWDFSYYILSLDINDTKGWHDIALLALKDTVVGSGWRFLKAHSMYSFFSQEYSKNCVGGFHSLLLADKLQVSNAQYIMYVTLLFSFIIRWLL